MSSYSMEKLLIDFGEARRALFAANEDWIASGKPTDGPVAAEWHRARALYTDALAAIDCAADAVVQQQAESGGRDGNP